MDTYVNISVQVGEKGNYKLQQRVHRGKEVLQCRMLGANYRWKVHEERQGVFCFIRP
jgi:hypothetical protein